MDEATYRERLAADGYTEVLEKTIEPNSSNELHEHPYDASLYIAAGELTLGTPSGDQVFQLGEVCVVPRNSRHCERYGEAGARLVIGRRY
jgi:quercetin dioxygenase-like cupin family protein